MTQYITCKHAALMMLLCLLPMPLWADSIQIESGKMVLFHKTNHATFSNGVHLTRADFELFSDRLEAYYHNGALERAEAFGHIRLLQGDVHGTSDKAILNQKNNTLTLSGHAVLIQKGSRLEGETIVHNMDKETTVVTAVKGGRTHMTIESNAPNNKNSSVLPSSGTKQ